MLSYTFRITPKNKNSLISKKKITSYVAHKQSKIKKLLLMREGGEGTGVPLHYHGIIKTNYSRASIRNFVQSQLTKEKLKGAEYSLKDAPIEKQENPKHAYNYVCKEGQIYITIGYSKEVIKNYQEEYKKQKVEAKKNLKQRGKDKMRVIIDRCKTLKKNQFWEHKAIRIILEEYNKRDLLPPIGYQIQKIIGRILMVLDLDTYIKNVQLSYQYSNFYSHFNNSADYQKICGDCGRIHDVLDGCE